MEDAVSVPTSLSIDSVGRPYGVCMVDVLHCPILYASIQTHCVSGLGPIRMVIMVRGRLARIHKSPGGKAYLPKLRFSQSADRNHANMARSKRIKPVTEDENTPPSGPVVVLEGVRRKRGALSKVLKELPEDIEYEVRMQSHFLREPHMLTDRTRR